MSSTLGESSKPNTKRAGLLRTGDVFLSRSGWETIKSVAPMPGHVGVWVTVEGGARIQLAKEARVKVVPS
jgi:hypothetical protein